MKLLSTLPQYGDIEPDEIDRAFSEWDALDITDYIPEGRVVPIRKLMPTDTPYAKTPPRFGILEPVVNEAEPNFLMQAIEARTKAFADMIEKTRAELERVEDLEDKVLTMWFDKA